MPFAFKPLNLDDISVVDSVVHKTQTLLSGSDGVFSIQFRSGSLSQSSDIILSESGSHWNFLSNTFYKSASRHYYNNELHRFYGNTNAAIGYSGSKQQHLNKFNISGSILSIPQYYFGETIKKGSFILTDNSTAKTMEIKDDGNGNLYSSNAAISRSSATPISSSVNYLGNIYYDLGVVAITETSSFSHTPSTSSFIIETAISHSNYVQITGSDLVTSIKFQVISGSTPADTDTIKYLLSGSSKAVTAQNFADKINSIFANYVTASAVGFAVTMSNDIQPLPPVNKNDNLPLITGSTGLDNFNGFGGGVAEVNYTSVGTGQYKFQFDSTQTIYTKEFSVTIKPEEFNHTMNPTVRAFASGGSQQLLTTPYMLNDFTSSLWKPYITGIQLYGKPYRDSKGTNTRVTNIDEPLIIAKLPRPVKMRDDMTMIFKIRLDM